MTDAYHPQLLCRRCRGPIDAGDAYCRHCAAPTGKPGRRPDAWWESPWMVLALLFLVLGPLALPLLWRSRHFTVGWKIVLTLIVSGITIYMLWQVWFSLNQALAPFQELQNLNRR